ncbi:hypothetical protein K432DRAFT_395355 [Lepidopterella palustris CBS 459.81]|uniref:Uncharacterized protein n=1 Tax=Lepidopterella palustris CBS 459.81 TaxID=1314670 RepID=A0A8E2E5H0_9PEZI|nr:hypothetical protein K432DRAFT_395355 [Lepidopterella palustris CBS 459.81]
MKFSAFSIFALSALFVGALSSPVASVQQHDVSISQLENRDVQDSPDLTTILTELLAEVQNYTSTLNATVAALPPAVQRLGEDEQSLIRSVKSSVGGIISALSTATDSISKLSVGQLVGTNFQQDLSLTAEIVSEIYSTLNSVSSNLQLTISEIINNDGPILVAAINALTAAVGFVFNNSKSS